MVQVLLCNYTTYKCILSILFLLPTFVWNIIVTTDWVQSTGILVLHTLQHIVKSRPKINQIIAKILLTVFLSLCSREVHQISHELAKNIWNGIMLQHSICHRLSAHAVKIKPEAWTLCSFSSFSVLVFEEMIGCFRA